MKKIILSLIIILSFALICAEDYHDVSMTPSLRVTVWINGDAQNFTMTSWSAQLYSTDGTAVGTEVTGNTTPGSVSNVKGCFFDKHDVNTSIGYITVDIGNLGYNFRRYRTTTALGGQTEYIQVVPETGHDPTIPRYVEGEYTYNTSGVLTDGPTLEITYNIGAGDVTINPSNTGWAGSYIGITEENSTFFYDGSGWDEGGILPVTLSSFTAVLTDGVPILQWITQSEMNNAGWNVFRAEIDEQDESVKVNNEFIPGYGTSSQPQNYVFEDEYELDCGNTYYYWLESIAFSGVTETYGPVSLYIPTEEENETPEVLPVYGLHQNYPNPFNPDTYISFALEEDGPVKLAVYNLKGQRVKTLLDGEVEKDKNVTVIWDGLDEAGKQSSSGVYFYRLQTSSDTYNRKMVMTK